jgi:hypothetical protein
VRQAKLKKQLGLLDVFCVAAGAMISSGLFVLPAIAYTKAGRAVILAYFPASLLVLPSVFCQGPLLISAGFVALSGAWYGLYVSQRVSRASAAMHIVKGVIDEKFKTFSLDSELRYILIERDEIITDRFDQLIKDCEIIDLPHRMPAGKAFQQAANILAARLETDQYLLFAKLLQREAKASTGCTHLIPGICDHFWFFVRFGARISCIFANVAVRLTNKALSTT